MDGLIMLVADHLKLNPSSGQLFLFRNRHANKIKLLCWERNGFGLCYKHFEQGKLKFPPKSEQVTLLNPEQFSWLLSGLDFSKHELLPEVTATNFF